jgi:hypothetical protein
MAGDKRDERSERSPARRKEGSGLGEADGARAGALVRRPAAPTWTKGPGSPPKQGLKRGGPRRTLDAETLTVALRRAEATACRKQTCARGVTQGRAGYRRRHSVQEDARERLHRIRPASPRSSLAVTTEGYLQSARSQRPRPGSQIETPSRRLRR